MLLGLEHACELYASSHFAVQGSRLLEVAHPQDTFITLRKSAL